MGNISGPEYFAYANPTILRLIQELPGVERLANYRRVDLRVNA